MEAGSFERQVGFNIWPAIQVRELGSAVWKMYLGQWIFRAYQLVCNSMEAHDLPSPVLVARIVEYWIEMHDFDPDS